MPKDQADLRAARNRLSRGHLHQGGCRRVRGHRRGRRGARHANLSLHEGRQAGRSQERERAGGGRPGAAARLHQALELRGRRAVREHTNPAPAGCTGKRGRGVVFVGTPAFVVLCPSLSAHRSTHSTISNLSSPRCLTVWCLAIAEYMFEFKVPSTLVDTLCSLLYRLVVYSRHSTHSARLRTLLCVLSAVCTHLSVSAPRACGCVHTLHASTPLAARCVTLTRHTHVSLLSTLSRLTY